MINDQFMILEPQTSWPTRLPFDFALGEDPATLVTRYDITPTQFQSLLFTPAFMKEVDKHRQEILENGVTFRLKAKLQAEEYLQELDAIVHDAETSPAVKLDAIKSAVKWAGYEPKETRETSSASSGPTRLVIQWADGSGQIALETNA